MGLESCEKRREGWERSQKNSGGGDVGNRGEDELQQVGPCS